MKKVFSLLGVLAAMAMLFTLFSGAVLAQGPQNGTLDGVRSPMGGAYGPAYGFVDENNDGINDHFVDADGDGVCDLDGPAFVDTDGDGVCDNAPLGGAHRSSLARGMGRGMAWRNTVLAQ